MKTQKSFGLFLIVLLVCSCGGLKPINSLPALTKNPWTLSSLMENNLGGAQNQEKVPSISFLEGGKLAGFSGCNNFSGSFSLEGSTLKLDPGAITKKSCPGTSEQDFLSAMERVNQFKLVKNTLTLFDGSAELMRLTLQED